MKHRWLGIVALLLCTLLAATRGQGQAAPAERGPYARIAILRPHEGDTVDFEAGYIRHLEWHRQAKDSWAWYGWTIWAGDRQLWFVYATFGHTAASLDAPVNPVEDQRDTLLNVTPHAEFRGNGLYEYLPDLSRGTGEPEATARLEFTTVELKPGAEKAFEAILGAKQPELHAETLWYRMLAGGTTPRYVRLRPRPSLSAILDEEEREQTLPKQAEGLIAKTTVEILTLRPAMCYGLPSGRP